MKDSKYQFSFEVRKFLEINIIRWVVLAAMVD